MDQIKESDSSLPYQLISTTFCVIVVVSNIISAKMVLLPYLNFVIPAGLITYPLTFLLSDLVTEIFGAQKAKRMVYMTLGMNLLTFGIIQMALAFPESSIKEQSAFQEVLGSSGLRIFSSLVAYSISQIFDIQIYATIKRWTGLRFLWIRANGSTWMSQLVDTIVIDLIFLYWGLGMELIDLLPIMAFSMIYKMTFSLAITPIFYLLVYIVNHPSLKEGA